MTRARDAFDLLRAANPVPSAPRARGRRRLQVGLVFTAVLLAVLLVAPAIGIPVPPVNFWKAEKAPPRVVHDFETLSEGAPPGMDPGAISGETRKLSLSDGQTLWVAPTRHGGFCTLGAGGGGCDKLGTVPLSVSWFARRVAEADMTAAGPRTSAFDAISGHVNAKYGETVEVRFRDGQAERLELTWVSEPIGAGFFHYTVPADRRREGHEIVSVVALDSSGRVVSEQRRERGAAPPADAVLGEKRALVRRGEVVIWQAPTLYEGSCTWLEFRGDARAIAPCIPKGYDEQSGLSVAIHDLGGATLVGRCGYRTLQIAYPDGSLRAVRCRDGVVLVQLRAGELVGELRVVDGTGRADRRSSIPLSSLRMRDSAR